MTGSIEAVLRVLSGLGDQPTLLAAAGATLAGLGGTALVAFVTASFRLRRRRVVARLPFTGEHAMDLPRPGRYALHFEAPMLWRSPFVEFFGRQVGGPRLSLRDESTREELPLETPLLPVKSSGFSHARLQLRSFYAPKAGRYILTCAGVDPHRDWSEYMFVVTHPYTLTAMGLVLATIAALMALMGGLALLGWWGMIRLGL